jgi:hypothetical protein
MKNVAASLTTFFNAPRLRSGTGLIIRWISMKKFCLLYTLRLAEEYKRQNFFIDITKYNPVPERSRGA